MEWTRRNFLRSASLAVVGGVFVPKYERWFRPNTIITFPPSTEGWGSIRWIAIFDTKGEEITRIPVNPNGRTWFPTVTKRLNIAEAATVYKDGTVKLIHYPIPKLILPGDQLYFDD